MSKKTEIEQHAPDRIQELDEGFPPAELLEGAVKWVRALKAEGVTPDVALESFVHILDNVISEPDFDIDGEECHECEYS